MFLLFQAMIFRENCNSQPYNGCQDIMVTERSQISPKSLRLQPNIINKMTTIQSTLGVCLSPLSLVYSLGLRHQRLWYLGIEVGMRVGGGGERERNKKRKGQGEGEGREEEEI